MIFCHNCGAQQPDTTRFCTSCGTRLDRQESSAKQPGAVFGSPPPPPLQTPNWPEQPGRVAPAPHAAPTTAPDMSAGHPDQPDAWHPAAPATPRAAGISAGTASTAMPSLNQLGQRYGGDWSRALISILLLMLSLSMGWNSHGSSADYIPALLAIIVALPIGVVDLLLRPALVGRVFDASQRLMFRTLLAAPLVAVALWALIDNLINGSGFGAGIGVALTGAAVGITGAVTMSEPGQARLWLTVAAGSLVVSLLWLGWAVVQTIKGAVAIGAGAGSAFWLYEIVIVCMLIWMAWLVGWLAQLAFSGSLKTEPIACWLAACLGVWLILARLFTVAFGVGSAMIGADSVMTGAIAFFAVGVALLTASSIRKALPQPPAFGWMTAAHTGLLILGTAHLLNFFTIGLTLSQMGTAKGGYVWLLVLQMAGAAGALVTRSALGRDSKTGRISVLVYAAAFTAAFWLTYLIADSVMVTSYAIDDAVLMVGPTAVAFCLLVPPSVRQMLGPIGVPTAFQGMQVAPGAPGAPGTPPAPGYPPGQVPDGQFRGGPPASPDAPQEGGWGQGQ